MYEYKPDDLFVILPSLFLIPIAIMYYANKNINKELPKSINENKLEKELSK